MLLHQGAVASQDGPREISGDQSCGKCGMFPANYPKWQTQIIFSDGSMVPFDGSKCMFGFMFNMGKFDTTHNKGDIAKIWVRDFNSGEWTDAASAVFVVGSEEMGPMGKELIPFRNQADAEAFQKEKGGQVTAYDAVSMETLKPLMGKMGGMGKMHMKGKMKMDGQMAK
jgi:nitrous oxide reductase accessory protein NosL